MQGFQSDNKNFELNSELSDKSGKKELDKSKSGETKRNKETMKEKERDRHGSVQTNGS